VKFSAAIRAAVISESIKVSSVVVSNLIHAFASVRVTGSVSGALDTSLDCMLLRLTTFAIFF